MPRPAHLLPLLTRGCCLWQWGGPGNQQRLYAAAAAFADSLLPAGYDTMVVDMGWYFEQSDAAALRGVKEGFSFAGNDTMV